MHGRRRACCYALPIRAKLVCRRTVAANCRHHSTKRLSPHLRFATTFQYTRTSPSSHGANEGEFYLSFGNILLAGMLMRTGFWKVIPARRAELAFLQSFPNDGAIFGSPASGGVSMYRP